LRGVRREVRVAGCEVRVAGYELRGCGLRVTRCGHFDFGFTIADFGLKGLMECRMTN